jgi:ferrous iron transport protein A
MLSGSEKFISRATAMGFTPDTDVSVLRNRGLGPLIVSLRDTEIAIGRSEAAKITLKEA